MKTPTCLTFFLLLLNIATATDAPVITKVRFQPAAGQAADMVGGHFAGSNTGQTFGFTVLATIGSEPAEGQMTELSFSNTTPYRYVIYEGPEGSRGIVAEVEFFEGNSKLSGTAFGVAGQHDNGVQSEFPKALDGDATTYYEAPIENGAYAGLDLSTAENVVSRPFITPEAGSYQDSQTVTLSSDPGATIRYTTDGSLPTRDYGSIYSGPFTLTNGVTTIRAVAYTATKFNSVLADSVFLIGPDVQVNEVSSYHIGNSLTDTFVNGALAEVASSAGFQPSIYKFSIPGAPTDWLWNHPNTGNGVNLPSGTNTRNVAEAFPQVAPLMHLTTQPFSGHNRSLANEATHSGYFFKLARQSSPNVQFWLYSQWPRHHFGDGFASGSRLREVGIDVPAATTWEEGALNHMRYFEELRQRVDDAQAGQPVGIIPTAHALIRLKRAWESGEIPGLGPNNFLSEHFADGGTNIHMNNRGKYFVALVVFSTLYQTPPSAVDLPQSSSTLTDAQEAIYQQIAWEAVRSYRWAFIPEWQGYNIWRELEFGFLYSTEAYDWQTDQDNDSLNLFMEYVINGSVDSPETWTPKVLAAAAQTEFEFNGLRNDPVVQAQIWVTSDLTSSWQRAEDAGLTIDTAPTPGKPGFIDLSFTIPAGQDHFFTRIQMRPSL